jgi:hypothetical protein
VSATKQPVWKLVAQLGDVHPIDHGGHWIFIDTTGVYEPEAEVLIVPEEEGQRYEIRRYILEPCTYENGVLSDNSYHPSQAAWFADKVPALAASLNVEPDEFLRLLLSDVPAERAIAWHEIGQYFGWDNLDAYPLRLTRAEIVNRYSHPPYYEAQPPQPAGPDPRDAHIARLRAALSGLVSDWERCTGRLIPDDHEAKAALRGETK